MPVDTYDIKKYIEGIYYPASKYDLNYKARDNRAPDMVIDLINYLPERRFKSLEDVNEAVIRCME